MWPQFRKVAETKVGCAWSYSCRNLMRRWTFLLGWHQASKEYDGFLSASVAGRALCGGHVLFGPAGAGAKRRAQTGPAEPIRSDGRERQKRAKIRQSV